MLSSKFLYHLVAQSLGEPAPMLHVIVFFAKPWDEIPGWLAAEAILVLAHTVEIDDDVLASNGVSLFCVKAF